MNRRSSHPARGGWIEMPTTGAVLGRVSSPTPQGVGGLKYVTIGTDVTANRSHPARGGWIEIKIVEQIAPTALSHPARGGWIEIGIPVSPYTAKSVPPRKGWVD